MRRRIYLSSPPTGLDAYSQNAHELPDWVTPLLPPGINLQVRPTCAGQPLFASSRRHLAVQTTSGRFRNINRMSIAYDVRPRLRPD